MKNKIEPNNIYFGDAYELIKDMDDKSVDLVITDPPYQLAHGGIGNGGLAERKNKNNKEVYGLNSDTTKVIATGGGISIQRQRYLDYVSVHGKDRESERLRIDADRVDSRKNYREMAHGITNDILDELCRVMKRINIYIWCSKAQLRQLLDYFDDKECFIDLLTWHKTNPIPTCNNTYLSDTEYLVFARQKGVKVYGTPETKKKWYVSPSNTDDKKLYEHPTIKPLEIIKNLIINSSLTGQVVFDCFLGSGTTAVASKELGRKYIGFELNPKFYKIAVDRINGIDQKGQMSLLYTDFEKVRRGKR